LRTKLIHEKTILSETMNIIYFQSSQLRKQNESMLSDMPIKKKEKSLNTLIKQRSGF